MLKHTSLIDSLDKKKYIGVWRWESEKIDQKEASLLMSEKRLNKQKASLESGFPP